MGRGQRKQTTPPFQVGSRSIAPPMAIEVYRGNNDSQPLPDYDGLLLEFPRDLSKNEQDKASGILAYWAKLPFVANGSTENVWLTDNQLWIDASSHNSKSADWRLRRPFEILEDWMNQGTEPRKSQNGTRAFNGIGLAPDRIILSHPKRALPSKTPSPTRKPQKASDLLYRR